MAQIILVNDNDEIIGYKERNDRDISDIIRVSGLWIFNDEKEVLIAQRSHSKIHSPGKWGPSVAGTLEEGETYISNIIKEAKEEVGVVVNEQDLISGVYRFVSTDHRYFYKSFFTKINIPVTGFEFQKEEVEKLEWIHIEELLKWVEDKPMDFIDSFRTSESSLYAIADYLKSI